jgi:putative endonuclease
MDNFLIKYNTFEIPGLQVLFQNKKNNITKGRLGEELAMQFLVKKGFNFLDRNWRHGRSEIDLIFENQHFIVFVEVKLRHPDALVEPHMAVNKAKQKLIIKAADAWMKEKGGEAECRFDIVTILFEPGRKAQIDHIENAFYAFM